MNLYTNLGIFASVGPDDLVRLSTNPKIHTRTRNTSAGLGTATTGLQFLDNGHIQTYGNSSASTDSVSLAVNDGFWYANAPNAGIGSSYEIFVNTATQTGGNVAAITIEPTNATWLPLSTTRVFEITNEGNNVENEYTVEWDFDIRNATTTTVVYSGTIRLNANLFGP